MKCSAERYLKTKSRRSERMRVAYGPNHSLSAFSVPHRIGDARPAGGGANDDMTRKKSPRKPSGVHDARPIRPPARVTRRSSRAARDWSGANMTPYVDRTTSYDPSP